MLEVMWLIQSLLFYFLWFALAVNIWEDRNKLWILSGLLFFVIGLLAIGLGQPYWFVGLLAGGALACFIRARLRSK